MLISNHGSTNTETEVNANIKSWVFQHRDRGKCYFIIGRDLQTDRGNIPTFLSNVLQQTNLSEKC